MDVNSHKKDQLNWRGTKFAILLIILVLAEGCATVDDRKLNQVATDAEIELDINKRLFNRKNIDLFLDLQTNVYEGRVMLTGAVKSDFNRRRIETLATDYLLGRALSNLELRKVLTIAKRVKHVSKVIHHVVVRPLVKE